MGHVLADHIQWATLTTGTLLCIGGNIGENLLRFSSPYPLPLHALLLSPILPLLPLTYPYYLSFLP